MKCVQRSSQLPTLSKKFNVQRRGLGTDGSVFFLSVLAAFIVSMTLISLFRSHPLSNYTFLKYSTMLFPRMGLNSVSIVRMIFGFSIISHVSRR